MKVNGEMIKKKEIFYYNNGDREMGDYSNGKRIGKCVILKRNGEVKIKNY